MVDTVGAVSRAGFSCLVNCVRCGKVERRKAAKCIFCSRCSDEHKSEGRHATYQLTKLIRSGKMPKANQFSCVDCGKQAQDYDHRDYKFPFDISPVCRSCNQYRGPALDSQIRAYPPHIKRMRDGTTENPRIETVRAFLPHAKRIAKEN